MGRVGAALAAATTLCPPEEREAYASALAASLTGRGVAIEPDPKARIAYHGADGYLKRLASLFESATGLRLA